MTKHVKTKNKGRKIIMKSTGIVRKIDDLGRMVIPIELRKTMSIDKKDPMEIFVEDDRIILKKYEPACIFCGSADETIEFKGRIICKECMDNMNNSLRKEETA